MESYGCAPSSTVKSGLVALAALYALVKVKKDSRLPWPNSDNELPSFNNHRYQAQEAPETELKDWNLHPERDWRLLFGDTPLPPVCILRDAADMMTISDLMELSPSAATEGVRRLLYSLHRHHIGDRIPWSTHDCARMARQIAKEAGIDLEAHSHRRSAKQTDGLHPIAPKPIPLTMWIPLMMQAMLSRQFFNFIGMESTLISTKHGKFHVYDTKVGLQNDDSAPLCLLHGLFTTAQSMVFLGIVLAYRTGRRVLIPDHLGFDFGYSRTATNRTVGWHEHIETTIELLSAYTHKASTTFSKFVLVGHSYGGYVASEVACQRPELVKALALLSPAGHSRYRHAAVLAQIGVRKWAFNTLAPNMPDIFKRLAVYAFHYLGRTPRMTKMSDTCDMLWFLNPPGVSRRYLPWEHSDKGFHRRPPIIQPVFLLWPVDDTLHKPYFDPGSRQADAIIMRDFHFHSASKGYWVYDSSHGLNFDALLTCSEKLTEFLGTSQHVVTKTSQSYILTFTAMIMSLIFGHTKNKFLKRIRAYPLKEDSLVHSMPVSKL